ncbi:MFS general substrate transporter [Cristinia sonorae]|uniref:MFS general substrate transporter n=1 Tax=Cristinia sonorae TaxID=1940300 RepID=A0A8K0XKM1_9AGAR|nr:MFS general substrate transporter [Cristinia sonorae]
MTHGDHIMVQSIPVNSHLPLSPISAQTLYIDIEHVEVQDDPRKWPMTRKRIILLVISIAAMVNGLGANLYNPAISEIASDLHASSRQISWSLSLFILFQGNVPLLWSVLSEVYGRKKMYLLSLAICTVACVVAATAKSIGVLVGIRCLQAVGTSAVLSLGAATLADLYDPHERGAIMGLYYCAPLLGPALGPIIGGVLTHAFTWRATFWFLVIFTGTCIFPFLLFKDTFRRERSLTYQRIAKQLHQRALEESRRQSQTSTKIGEPGSERKEKESETPKKIESSTLDADGRTSNTRHNDPEAQNPTHDMGSHSLPPLHEIKVSLKDVNPIHPMILVFRRVNNILIVIASGLNFAFSYSIGYTCARTLSNNYHYGALKIGLVLLSFGVGNVLGSVLGGQWSDLVQKNLMRLRSIIIPMFILPSSNLAYAWVSDKHAHIAALCISLFFAGFSSIWIYSCSLAYMVDANVGRSCVRGTFGFVAAEVAVPLQDAIRDGGLYTLWAGLMLVSELLLLLVMWKGQGWRERAEEDESK